MSVHFERKEKQLFVIIVFFGVLHSTTLKAVSSLKLLMQLSSRASEGI